MNIRFKNSFGVKAIFYFFISIVILVSSCRKEDKKPSWETGIVTPLIKSSLGINDIVTDTLLVANPDSSLKLVYENHLYNIALDSLFVFFTTGGSKNGNRNKKIKNGFNSKRVFKTTIHGRFI